MGESDSDVGDVGVEGAGDGDNAGGVIGTVVVVAAVGCVSVRESHVARIRGMWDSPLDGLPVSKPKLVANGATVVTEEVTSGYVANLAQLGGRQPRDGARRA